MLYKRAINNRPYEFVRLTYFVQQKSGGFDAVAFLKGLRLFLYDFFALVVAACGAYAVCAIVLAALRTLYHAGERKLPNIGTSLVSTSLRYLSLRYCHLEYTSLDVARMCYLYYFYYLFFIKH